MGAIARQVLQVKRKNSTKCNPPEARLTVVGSVAWSSGPREVASGRAVASSTTEGSVAVSCSGGARVAVDKEATGGSVAAAGVVAADCGVQAVARAKIRVRLSKRWLFFITLK